MVPPSKETFLTLMIEDLLRATQGGGKRSRGDPHHFDPGLDPKFLGAWGGPKKLAGAEEPPKKEGIQRKGEKKRESVFSGVRITII